LHQWGLIYISAMGPGDEALPTFLRLAADPLRWQLLVELARSDLRVRDLAESTGTAQSLVSYHVRALRQAGLVDARRSSHDRRETYYRLDLDRCADAFVAAGGALHPSLANGLRPGGAASPPQSRELSVLFICTGNSARSPLAEAMLSARMRGWSVASAGSHPKAAFHPSAVQVLRDDYGLCPASENPRDWRTLTAAGYDCVISLCDKAREAWTRSSHQPPWAHWSIPDPAMAGGLAAFRRAARDIDGRIRHLVAALSPFPPPPPARRSDT
jgi:protein-tyrosine-phosphatase/DNA-binding transcriptional ArsR family regulator